MLPNSDYSLSVENIDYACNPTDIKNLGTKKSTLRAYVTLTEWDRQDKKEKVCKSIRYKSAVKHHKTQVTNQEIVFREAYLAYGFRIESEMTSFFCHVVCNRDI